MIHARKLPVKNADGVRESPGNRDMMVIDYHSQNLSASTFYRLKRRSTAVEKSVYQFTQGKLSANLAYLLHNQSS